MGKYQVGNFNLKVGKSRTGRGVFALEAIPKGACIIEYVGREMTPEEVEKSHNRYVFETGKNTAIDGNIAGNRARFINHSCKPNCEADGPAKKVFILALRNIKQGEELTYDYDKEYFDQYLSNGRCKCTSCVAKS